MVDYVSIKSENGILKSAIIRSRDYFEDFRMHRSLLVTAMIVFLAACANTGEMVSERDISKIHETGDAVWKSDGYGYILDMREEPTVYNQTGASCIVISENQENPMDYFDRFQINSKKTTLRLFHTVEPYPIVFENIAALPESCTQPPLVSPLEVFDAFSAFYSEHYAFFEVHGINWAEATANMRASLATDSNEMDLVERFIGLLSQLRDGHVSISAIVDGDEGQFISYPGITNQAIEDADTNGESPNALFGEQYLRQDIEQDILGDHGTNALNERLKYGVTSGDIGYLAIMAEGGYTGNKDVSLNAELSALNAAMPYIIQTFRNADVKAVIIDLSVNHGGYDFLGRAIAGYFTDAPVIAYSKHAGDATAASPYTLKVIPADGQRFTGPVYVMTSDITVSAGEVTTLSLRALPNVTHVGMPTRGAFSDVLTKYLPNGWEVTLSNEVYTDSDGVVWEGRGIEPEIKFEVFDPSAPLAGHMPAINTLIKIIDQHHTK